MLFDKEVFYTLVDNIKMLSYNILRSSHKYQNNLIVNNIAIFAYEVWNKSVQLARAVKNVMGKSALNIIHDIMLTKAKIQLRKQNISVQHIANYLNFSDQADFSKFFRKNTGVSPTAFRKSNYSN